MTSTFADALGSMRQSHVFAPVFHICSFTSCLAPCESNTPIWDSVQDFAFTGNARSAALVKVPINAGALALRLPPMLSCVVALGDLF